MSSCVRALAICLIPLKSGHVLPTLNVITAATVLITVTAFDFFVMPNSPVHFEADSMQEKRNILILTFCMLKRKTNHCAAMECSYFLRRFASFKHQTFLPCLRTKKKKKLFKKYSSQLNIWRLIWIAHRSRSRAFQAVHRWHLKLYQWRSWLQE